MNVRAGSLADAPVAAALHTSEIDEGFLPRLGQRFLRRLYRRIVHHPGSFLVVAEEDGSVMGFVAGSENVGALYRSFMVRDGVVAGVVALLRIVSSLPRVVETLRYPAQHRGNDLPAAELLALAVVPEARGRGVGRTLVDAFQEELLRRAVNAARVVTAKDNHPSLALYESCGFRPVSAVEVHEGVEQTVLVWP